MPSANPVSLAASATLASESEISASGGPTFVFDFIDSQPNPSTKGTTKISKRPIVVSIRSFVRLFVIGNTTECSPMTHKCRRNLRYNHNIRGLLTRDL